MYLILIMFPLIVCAATFYLYLTFQPQKKDGSNFETFIFQAKSTTE